MGRSQKFRKRVKPARFEGAGAYENFERWWQLPETSRPTFGARCYGGLAERVVMEMSMYK